MKQHSPLRRVIWTNLSVFLVSLVFLTFPQMPIAQITSATVRQDKKTGAEFIPNEIIIGLKRTQADSDPSATPEHICIEYGIRPLDIQTVSVHPAASTLRRSSIFAARVSDDRKVDTLIERLNQDSRVDYAERRVALPPTPLQERQEYRPLGVKTSSSNELREIQWALRSLQIPEGLAAQTKIGIVDTGVTPSGVLAENLVGGWDFYNDRPDFSDAIEHGTGVAGIVAGDFGALRHAQLYSLKCANPDGNIDTLAVSKAVDYAIEHGIKILNCSFGLTNAQPSETQNQAAERARLAGIIIIAACGNDSKNLDVVADTWNVPLYNVVRVAATSENDALAGFSNYGHGQVEICAPGDCIFLQGSNETTYIWGCGTSAAAPWITALSAILYDTASDWRQVIEQILRTVDRLPHLEEKVWVGGRANFTKAIARNLNSSLDSIRIDTAKIKKKKKLTLNATITPLGSPFTVSPVLRVYADDTLLAFETGDTTGAYSFFIKGKFPNGTDIILLSSGGGRADWANTQAQTRTFPTAASGQYSMHSRFALLLHTP